jgi:hypothetical protein
MREAIQRIEANHGSVYPEIAHVYIEAQTLASQANCAY